MTSGEPSDGETEAEALPWPDRGAGVLLHPTSLPGPYGVGGLGQEARNFVDMLVDAGQSVWQILPLGPAGNGNSPYAACSVFAGNPTLIALDRLIEEDLLESFELDHPPWFSPDRIDFPAIDEWREALLRKACERFLSSGRSAELDAFAERTHWLPDYALFAALHQAYDTPWENWPEPLAQRNHGAMADARRDLATEITYQEFLQWCFDRQWYDLRSYANSRSIGIFGDVPIFPDHDSADVWANPHLFKLDEFGHPERVAGVPPDAFSAAGQHWGNPLYRWDVLAAQDYSWWVERLRADFSRLDLLRIDHFRGFHSAWEIPAGDQTAERGEWIPGPGVAFFEAVRASMGDPPIVVEDLGVITREIRTLRDSLGYPGMAVLQFAFADDARNPYLPHNHRENLVVYTGTHDNDTTLGWFCSLGDWERNNVLRYLACDGSDIVSDMIRAAYSSVAKLAIVPMQDILNLGSDARLNVPGTATGNWAWRFRWDQVDGGRVRWLREAAEQYARTRPLEPG